MTKQRFTALLCTLALAGCASTTVKKAEAEFKESQLAYGAVVAVRPLAAADLSAQCRQARSDLEAVCRQPADYEQASVAILHSSRLVAGWAVVPKSWHVQYRSIVQLDPKHTPVATRLAAAEPRSGCRWTGYELDKLTGKDRLALVSGFAQGLLVLPAVMTAVDDSFQEGGVDCEGWSFRKLLHY